MKKLWEVQLSARQRGRVHAIHVYDIEADSSEEAFAKAWQFFGKHYARDGYTNARIVRWRRQGGGSFEL